MLNLFYLVELLHTEQRILTLDHCPGVSLLGSFLRWLGVLVWNFLVPPLVVAEKMYDTWAVAGSPGGELALPSAFAEYPTARVREQT